MATRRNRIKAVINVPRGGRPSAASDRPLTPLSTNLHEPSSPISTASPSASSYPLSPVKSVAPTVDRVRSPGPVHLPSSSSLLRSPSPAGSKLNLPPSSPTTSGNEYPCLTLVRSPASPAFSDRSPVHQAPNSPNRSDYGGFRSPPYNPHHYQPGSLDYNARSPVHPYSSGGIQRPSPSQSPTSMSYRSGTTSYSNVHSPFSSGMQRPSPAPSPSAEGQRSITSGYNFSAPHTFNTNSNSADSHEVAGYMSIGSPSGFYAPSPVGKEIVISRGSSRQEGTGTPSSMGGAFSSVSNMVKDHAHSIVGNSDLLRQRLQKPSPALTVSKYQTLKKEFMAKHQNAAPERKKLTMLHLTFWNPPKGPGSRSRASSVCSERGGKAYSDHDANSRHSLPEMEGKAARRSTIETIIPTKKEDSKKKESVSDSVPEAEPTHDGPRVKVGPDGQLIIDEQSLIIETSESQRAKQQLSEMETISGADFIVGSCGLFRNKKTIRRGIDWSVKETVKFYKALSMCGTDFSMMSRLFPSRTRTELKSKFKREDRRNPEQISKALSQQEFDPDEGFSSSDDEDALSTAGNGCTENEHERRLKEAIEEESPIFSIKKDNLVKTNSAKKRSKNSNKKDSGKPTKSPKKRKLTPSSNIEGGAGGQETSWRHIGVSGDEPEPAEPESDTPFVVSEALKKLKQEISASSVFSKPSNPQVTPVTKGKKKPPRPSKVIETNVVPGNSIPNSPIDSANSPCPLNADDISLPPKKRARPKPNVNKPQRKKPIAPDEIKKEKQESSDKQKKSTMDIMEILRFDETDPLGLKVVPVPAASLNMNTQECCNSDTARESVSDKDLVTLTPVTTLANEEQPHLVLCVTEGLQDRHQRSISPGSFVEDFNLNSTSNSNSTSIPPSPHVVKVEKEGTSSGGAENTDKKVIKPQPKIKGLPYRVPGGGPVNVKSPNLAVDEIEIEIACQ